MVESLVISTFGWTYIPGTHSEARLAGPRRDSDPTEVVVRRTGISHGPGGWDLSPARGRLTIRPVNLGARHHEPGS